MREDRKRGGKLLVILLSVIVLLLAVAGILFGLAMSDPNEPLPPDGKTDSSAVAVKLVSAAATGEPAKLTGEEVSAMLTQKLAQGKQSAVQGVRLTVNSDNTVAAYLPVVYKGIKLGVSANLTVGWDATKNLIRVAVNSMKIGRLPVNSARMLSRVKDKLPQGVEVQGSVLSIAPDLLGAYAMPNDAMANISGLSVEDQKFVVNVTADLGRLTEYLKEKLKSLL
nr:hypothetical protein [uncultured Caproiciproducens sp.]